MFFFTAPHPMFFVHVTLGQGNVDAHEHHERLGAVHCTEPQVCRPSGEEKVGRKSAGWIWLVVLSRKNVENLWLLPFLMPALSPARLRVDKYWVKCRNHRNVENITMHVSGLRPPSSFFCSCLLQVLRSLKLALATNQLCLFFFRPFLGQNRGGREKKCPKLRVYQKFGSDSFVGKDHD